MNPVADEDRTFGLIVPVAAVVAVITTVGAAGRVAENATVICDPDVGAVPDPNVSDPRTAVDPVPTTGVAAPVPLAVTAGAVTVVESQGLYAHTAVEAPVANVA